MSSAAGRRALDKAREMNFCPASNTHLLRQERHDLRQDGVEPFGNLGLEKQKRQNETLKYETDSRFAQTCR